MILKNILKIISFLQKFIIASINIGSIQSFKYFFSPKKEINFLKIKNIKHKIYYRNFGDKGAISHLYNKNYKINDSRAKEKIRNIIDGGANIGVETIRFANFFPNAKIISVEANKSNYEILKKNKLKDKYEIINDTKVMPVFKLLKKINWENMSNGIPVRFHGDYHFENIVYDKKKFIFLDWRQDFNGILDYGDIYYDLAKLLHGIIVSHQNVVDNKFSIIKNKTKTFISIKKINNYKKIFQKYLSWLSENNYDLNKVHLITALIYLNIATLHHHPYDKFLFSLGKLYLNNILNNDYNNDKNHKIFDF